MSQKKQHATCHLPPATVELDRTEAAHGKHCLQSALELATNARATLLPGPLSETLDHMSRMIRVGITALRDADKIAMGEGVYCREKAQKPQKEDKPLREKITVTCPKCGTKKETTSKAYVQCLNCRFTWQHSAKNPGRSIEKQRASGGAA